MTVKLVPYTRAPLPPLPSSLNPWLQNEDLKVENCTTSLIAAVLELQAQVAALQTQVAALQAAQSKGSSS